MTNSLTRRSNRRSFITQGLAATSVGLLANRSSVFAEEVEGGGITKGDAAILRFLAAAEIIETDLWQQYNELGGIQDSEVPGGTGSKPYRDALNNLDGDMSQYIHDNTEDEMSHFKFINEYLKSKGADQVSLDPYKILPSSQAPGAQNIPRLTNLMQLTVDTSWWGRYRSRTMNPDLDPGFMFPQAVPDLSSGQHPAIPRNSDDLTPKDHIQAIANTAAFHFGFIEQGGSSLYPSLAQRVTDPEVLRILLSIGPTETSHFQTWHDKAGNAVSDPLAPLTDPKNSKLTFPNLNLAATEDLQPNLIMPEPTFFLSRKFPVVSIIRPTQTQGAAMGAINSLMRDGLFIGQTQAFIEFLTDLAQAADSARRGGD